MNSENTNSSSRRTFLKLTAAAVTLAYFVPASALGANGKPPPSERIRLGLMGCGGLGRANLNNCAEHSDVVVTGACDPWKSRRDTNAKLRVGRCPSIGGPGSSPRNT